ncbi:MAG TPA: nuclear transport factor 2 family protein [Rhodopseudomonas sp.]|uniref:nuclear transport factor 2 family protein n=1 Tax=Rhodopseudomonas sp. TaxID=1078 RepID=UPI002EDB1B1D
MNGIYRPIGQRLLTLAGLCMLQVFASAQPAAAANQADITGANKQKVEAALTAWSDGTGNITDLLSDDIRWTIVGNSAAAGTFVGKSALLEQVLQPFGARFSGAAGRFRPVAIKGIYGDGATVVALFDGRGTTLNGTPYANSYAWILRMDAGRVVDATAFFDSIAFNQLWNGVTPAP